MHEERVANGNRPLRQKTLVTTKDGDSKTKTTVRKRLRDAAMLEQTEQPLNEALVHLNHLLKIGIKKIIIYRHVDSSG